MAHTYEELKKKTVAELREIAKETGVKIGGELYSDSMGPEGSAAETYIGMMRENTLLIVNSLK